MTLDRRGFLASCLALAAAPAIVRADSLMRIVPREVTIIRLGPTIFTEEVLRILEQNMAYLNNMNREYGLLFGGESVPMKIRRPHEFKSSTH